MKRSNLFPALTAICSIAFMASCSSVRQSMREPNTRVELEREDFILSPQVGAQAKTVTVLGIDFPRFFRKEEGYVGNVPVIGNFSMDKTSNYALYNLMRNNPGYDVIFYPQYEIRTLKPVLGLGFITRITTVNAKARLGKLEADED